MERSRELEQEVDQLELPQRPPVASPEDVDVLVTDDGADPAFVAELEQRGVEVLVA